MARSYVVSIAGGTATATVQMTASQTLKTATVSIVNAAAGSIEISRSPTSQIATAQPTVDVIARTRCSATAGPVPSVVIPINVPMKILEYIYVHCTGAGNVGEVTLA